MLRVVNSIVMVVFRQIWVVGLWYYARGKYI